MPYYIRNADDSLSKRWYVGPFTFISISAVSFLFWIIASRFQFGLLPQGFNFRFHYECQPDQYDPDHDLLITIRFETSPKLADDDYLFASMKKMVARVILYAMENKELPYLHVFKNGEF